MGNKTSIRIVNSQVRSKPKNHQCFQVNSLGCRKTTVQVHWITSLQVRWDLFSDPNNIQSPVLVLWPNEYNQPYIISFSIFSTDSQSAVLVWDPSGYNASLQSWCKKILCGLWWSFNNWICNFTNPLLIWGRLPRWKQRLIATNYLNYIIFLVNALMFYHECFPSIPVNKKR